jgi:hypothetical protein
VPRPPWPSLDCPAVAMCMQCALAGRGAHASRCILVAYGQRFQKPSIIGISRVQLVLFGMQNSTFGPHLATMHKILFSVIEGVRLAARFTALLTTDAVQGGGGLLRQAAVQLRGKTQLAV